MTTNIDNQRRHEEEPMMPDVFESRAAHRRAKRATRPKTVGESIKGLSRTRKVIAGLGAAAALYASGPHIADFARERAMALGAGVPELVIPRANPENVIELPDGNTQVTIDGRQVSLTQKYGPFALASELAERYGAPVGAFQEQIMDEIRAENVKRYLESNPNATQEELDAVGDTWHSGQTIVIAETEKTRDIGKPISYTEVRDSSGTVVAKSSATSFNAE